MTSRSSQYFVQNHNALVAPYVAQYLTPSAALTFAPASYVVANSIAAPLIASPAVAPLVANPVVAPSPGAVATQQPVPSSNPDAETVEVESARVRSLTPVQRFTQQQQQPIRAAQQQQQPIRPLNLRLLPVTQPQQQNRATNAKVQTGGQRTAAPGVVNGQQFLFA